MKDKIIYIEEAPVRLIPEKRRSIRLIWDRQERLIRCFHPCSLSGAVLKNFLEKRKKRLLALYSQAFFLGEGASLLYGGKEYRLSSEAPETGKTFFRDDLAMTIRTSCLNEGDLFFTRWKEYLDQEAPLCFHEKIGFWEDKTGEKASRWRFRPMRSRWGSASSLRAITLNTLLVMAPGDVVDYVILHELTHLKVADHSFRFWKEVARFMPDFQHCRSWLRENGNKILSLY